ncbi:Phytosulfokine [Corchorus olitorius]|uniref:Phytosulfokine n=1 Tax=Corchorus olitorius TaxID=93759 RepID=A0A1R3GZ59_9ROSI|nr:Phytosulfokine [Corchorus olitorius]
MIVFLLFFILSSSTASAARPNPAAADHHHHSTQQVLDVGEAEQFDEVEEIRCDGIDENECLMRRTLAAHIDYIYTQKNKP